MVLVWGEALVSDEKHRISLRCVALLLEDCIQNEAEILMRMRSFRTTKILCSLSKIIRHLCEFTFLGPRSSGLDRVCENSRLWDTGGTGGSWMGVINLTLQVVYIKGDGQELHLHEPSVGLLEAW